MTIWLISGFFLSSREDCFHLSQALPHLIPDDESYPEATSVLGARLTEAIFNPFAEKRQPRTSYLVKGARAMGEQRTATGKEACQLRDEMITKKFGDEALLASKLDELLKEPFNSV